MNSNQSEEKIAQKYFQGAIGNSTLVNLLGITEQEELDETEAYYVEYAIANGLSEKAKELSPSGLKQMHKEFFGDIYQWAGNFRNYTTGRGLPFCRPEYIEKELNKLYQKLEKSIQPNMDKEQFIKQSAFFVGELNVIHPFIDGNGRTQRQVLSLIAEKAGFQLDINKLNKEDWYRSAEECHKYATYKGFENIISSIIKDNDLEISQKPEITSRTQLLEEQQLTKDNLKKDYPNLSNDTATKIEIMAMNIMSKYTSVEAQKAGLEILKNQLPDIASGKIILPDLPTQDKGKGGR